MHKFLPLLFLIMAQFASTSLANDTRASYVSIAVSNGEDHWSLGAKLSYPLTSHNGAAVLIVHGSGGIDSRGELHTRTLNNAGFVTLEIDLWAARGWIGKSMGRPRGVPETLPDVFAALSFLGKLEGVDPDRIGLLGFSWGGVLAMLSRSSSYLESLAAGNQFAANVAFYPVCWVYNKVPGYELNSVIDSPLLILSGELDAYDTPTSCEDWKRTLGEKDQENVDIIIYPRSHHAFNTSAAPVEVTDPFSHQGKGGQVMMKSNKRARRQSDRTMLKFFLNNLVPKK